MFTDLLDDSDSSDSFCRHGYKYDQCDECDAIIEADGGIDKCLNCGRYKSGNQLNENQCCKRGCVNPNEY